MQIPAKLRRNLSQANAGSWLAELPDRVRDLAQRWNLRVQEPYPDCGYAFVAPATQAGRPLVLKVQWPHPECQHEAEALRRWNGQGAVRLLAADPDQHAYLMERGQPGVHLAGSQVKRPMDVMAELLPKLCIPATTPFTSLTTEALGWQAQLHPSWEHSGSRCEKRLVDTAYGLIDELVQQPGEQVLLHQDLHGHNVISARDAQWLAIDPKPLVGERAFALSPVVRSLEFGATRADVLHRLDRLTERLDVDRKRACAWAAIQSLAWSFNSDREAQQQQVASWLLADQQ